MQYKKQQSIQGGWVKASELTNGTLAKLVSETKPMEGQFGAQDVAKIRFKDSTDVKNVSLNKTTLNALIDSFGDDSKNWVDKHLTVHTEKMVVSGRRTTALYLIPEGYELTEDEGGYLVITNPTKQPEVKEKIPTINVDEGEVSPDQIPF